MINKKVSIQSSFGQTMRSNLVRVLSSVLLVLVLVRSDPIEDDRKNVISDSEDDYDWLKLINPENEDEEVSIATEEPTTTTSRPSVETKPTKLRADPLLQFEENIYFKYFDG